MRERMQVHERGYCCQGEKGYWCVKKDKGCTKLYERKDVGLGVRERVWVGVGMRERVLVCKRKKRIYLERKCEPVGVRVKAWLCKSQTGRGCQCMRVGMIGQVLERGCVNERHRGCMTILPFIRATFLCATLRSFYVNEGFKSKIENHRGQCV